MTRIRRPRLEPVGRYAILVTAVHAVIGIGLWWWFHSRPVMPESSSDQNLVWMSPEDFSTAAAASKAENKPAPVVAETTPAPAKPATEADDDDKVPKAIAVDPAQAAAIMAKALAAEKAAAEAAAQAPSTSAPAVAETSKPDPKVEPPKRAEEPVKTEPPAVASTPPSKPAPAPPPPPVPTTVASNTASPQESPASPPKEEPKPVIAPPATNVARFITISHPAPPSPKEAPKVASLLEVAALDASSAATGSQAGIRLDDIDRALIEAFIHHWTPPESAKRLTPDQRTVPMLVIINREGRLIRFKPTKSSGSAELDASVVEAGDRLDKIGTPLPASYPHDLYEVQVNFHVE